MPFDLIPSSFLNWPSVRLPSLTDDDSDFTSLPFPGGISVSEDDKNIIITAALPGVDEKDIDVTFDKGYLWIKGEAKVEEEDKKRKFYKRSASSFSYRVPVPGDVDLNSEPDAVCKNGVMTVTFAKSPQVSPKKISVKIKK